MGVPVPASDAVEEKSGYLSASEKTYEAIAEKSETTPRKDSELPLSAADTPSAALEAAADVVVDDTEDSIGHSGGPVPIDDRSNEEVRKALEGHGLDEATITTMLSTMKRREPERRRVAVSGSFRESCNNCFWEDEKFSCVCETGNAEKTHSLRLSAIDPASCYKPGVLTNEHGYLRCAKDHTPAMKLSGSFKGSCRKCSWEDGKFSCTCKTGKKFPYKTMRVSQIDPASCSTSYPCYKPGAPSNEHRCYKSALSNERGYLQCEKKHTPSVTPSVPSGPFEESCSKCFWEFDNFICRCETGKAYPYDTQFSYPINPSSCPKPGVLINQHGNLYCEED